MVGVELTTWIFIPDNAATFLILKKVTYKNNLGASFNIQISAGSQRMSKIEAEIPWEKNKPIVFQAECNTRGKGTDFDKINS